MCGIVGLLNLDGRSQVDLAAIHRMNDRIVHRGPDDSGHIDFTTFGMAMRRLSIVDVAHGKQPISNEDGTIWVTMNGEIYNYPELRVELSAAGHQFRTSCDTESLVHAYEHWGDDFATHLNGMYGFALWDDNRKRLILGRDRLGIKPLFYFADDQRLAFGSEFKSLMELDFIPREVDLAALDEFMTLEYVLAPKTLCKGVRKLEPGHLLIVDKGRVEKRRTWTPAPGRPVTSEQDAEERLYAEMRASVKRQLMSDVPLGAFLSGGIDSSIVVGLMSELMPDAVKTFSIGFEDASYNELKYARRIAERFGTDHEECVLKLEPASFLDDFIGYLDEPIGDVSVFPTFLVSKLARRKVKVALSGDGGDELFGGYDTYLAHRADALYRRFVPGVPRAGLRALIDFLPPTGKKKGPVNKLKRFVEGGQGPAEIEHYRWMTFLDDDARARLYTDKFRAGIKPGNAFRRLRKHFADAPFKNGDAVNRQSYVDLCVYLVEDILPKVDVTSMANSLEVRVPFLDHNVVELALAMPGSMKIQGWERKAILKKTFRHLLPDDILNRKKEGFSIPLKNWLRAELNAPMRQVLNRGAVEAVGLFSWPAVEAAMREHEAGTQNHAHRLWCLMVFHLWHQKYLGRRLSADERTLCYA